MSYPNLRLTPAMAARSLADLKRNFAESHRFWVDEVSLTDSEFFDLDVLTGSRQVSDAYLAGLAFRNRGRVATLDTSIAWRAVRGATVDLVDRLDD